AHGNPRRREHGRGSPGMLSHGSKPGNRGVSKGGRCLPGSSIYVDHARRMADLRAYDPLASCSGIGPGVLLSLGPSAARFMAPAPERLGRMVPQDPDGESEKSRL